MSYKYQQDILSALHEDVERRIENKNYIRKGQQNLADMHRCDTKRMASELNEIYAKAEAFDRISENLKAYDEESHDSLNVNYHDFGANTAHVIDEMNGGFWDE